MVHRTTERELDELAKNASNCIKHTGSEIEVGYSYGRPVDWFTKLLSLLIIQTSFTFVVYIIRCKTNNVSIY
jgi:hypothetical protein